MEIEAENSQSIQDYLQILHRRKYTILVPIAVFFLLVLIVTLALPPIYKSTATILIEQQKIPTELVKSTVESPVDERIMQIQQAMMTVDTIYEIIEKYQLYPTKNANRLDLAEKFRSNFSFELVNIDVLATKTRNNKVTLAFKLSFSHKNPILAQKTTSEITSRFLKENITSRTEGAKQTSDFLGQEAERFKQEIIKTENEIAEYKKKYSMSLPELLSTHLAEISRIEVQIQQITLQEQVYNEQKNSFQAQLEVTPPTPPDPNAKNVLPDDLPTLKTEYQRLLSKYSPLHPDVLAIKHKIDHYKAPDKETAVPIITNPVYVQIQGQLEMADVQQRSLMEQRKVLTEQLRILQEQVAQTPQVERGYAELMRDLDSNKEKYKELTEKYLAAKLSQSLEDEQRSERFSVSESPIVPTKPEKPDRLKIFLMGVAGSIVCGLGIGVGTDLIKSGVRGQQSIAFLTGMQPLIVIPYIQNQQDIDNERKKKRHFIILCGVLFIIAIIVIHILYMPLNIIFNNILSKVVEN